MKIAFATAAIMALVASSNRMDNSPVTLKLGLKMGERSSYKNQRTITTSQGEAVVNELVSEIVKEIKKDGTLVLVRRIEGGTRAIGGQDQDIPQGEPYTQEHDSRGKLLKYENDHTGVVTLEVAKTDAALGYVQFPVGNIKPGDKWETEIDNPMVKGKKIIVKTSFIGKEKVETTDLLKLKQYAEAATEDKDVKMSVAYTFWVNPESGRVNKMEGEIKDRPTSYGPLSMKVKSTLSKVVAK